MRKKMKKRTVVIMTILVLTLAACGQNGANGPSEEPGTDQENNQPTESEVIVKEASGTFTGLADSHTIEVILDNGEPQAFQFDESLMEEISKLQENDTVSLKYEEKAIEGEDTLKQRVLVEILKTGTSVGKIPNEDDDNSKSRPATQELTLTLEGMTEQKEASIISAADGYSLYVFDIFTFNPETGLLTMDVDPNYATQIEKLPSDIQLREQKEKGTSALAEYGEVEVVSEEKRPEAMKDASLFLTAKEEKSGTSHQYIVKELDGNDFVFNLTIPVGEPSEGFEPHVYASLNTIELE
ncbi:LptM family lipoprotein [Paenibacillus sp. Marseille-Q7038]